MRSILKYIIFSFLLATAGCERSDRINEFLRPAPVKPISEIIRTTLPIGNCAMIAMADQLGFPIPYEKIQPGGSFSIIRIVPSNDFPMIYLDESCREIIVLRFPADEDHAILSIFFIHEDPDNLHKGILEVHTIPAMIEKGSLKAVYASQDIYVRDSLELNLQMGPADIRIEMDRLETSKPATSEAAIKQNAWIIEIDPSGTWDLYTDDSYTITGGQQDVSVITGQSVSETSIIQLAMIGTRLGPECILAPVEGFALLREIGIHTGTENSLEDLVLGTVFFQFNAFCSSKVDIPLATGNFITSTGKKIELDLLD